MDSDRIVVSCWHCKGRLRLPVGKAGRVNCPHRSCGRSFWVNTRPGGGAFRKVQALWHNAGLESAGLVYCAALVLWLSTAGLLRSQRLIYYIFDGALVMAGGAWLFARSDSRHPFQVTVKLARIYVTALAVFAGIFSAIHLRLGSKVVEMLAQSTLADVERALEANNKWELGWVEPIRFLLVFLALGFCALLIAPAMNRRRFLMRRTGGYPRWVVGVHGALTLLMAFVLCGSISDAGIEMENHRVEHAREWIAWDYFHLRREMARALVARLLAEMHQDTPPAQLQSLVRETLDQRAAPAVKKITKFSPPFYLAPARGEFSGGTAAVSNLTEALSDSAPESSPVARDVASPEELKDFSIGRFYNHYSGFGTNWQGTREAVAALTGQLDAWEPDYGSIDRRQIPDTVSRVAIQKWVQKLPQWLGASPKPKEDVESVIEQVIDIDCNQVLSPSVANIFGRPGLDFSSEQVKACSDAFLDNQTQDFLAKLGAGLFAIPEPSQTNVMASFAAFNQTPAIKALVTRLKALNYRVKQDCGSTVEGVERVDAEIARRIDRDFPVYLRKFEAFALAQLELPARKIDPKVCQSVIRAFEARLGRESDAETRFTLLRKWGDAIAAQPNREVAERYRFLAPLEQAELGTTTLKDAVMELARAQERGTKWGAFRQELERALPAGQESAPIGRDHLRALLDKWPARRAEAMPEIYLTGIGDWEIEFARELVDLHDGLAWGEAIVRATNQFATEVQTALVKRGQWLQASEPAIGPAAADWAGRTAYAFGPRDFNRLPVLPEDGYEAYMDTLHPSAADKITSFSRLDLNEIEREDGYIHPAYDDCILMLARDVNYQKVVVARYPIQCPPGVSP